MESHQDRFIIFNDDVKMSTFSNNQLQKLALHDHVLSLQKNPIRYINNK